MRRLLLLTTGLVLAAISVSAQVDVKYRESLCHPQCWQCQPGECVVTTTGDVPNSGFVHIDNPPCVGFTPEAARIAIHAVAAYYSGGRSLAAVEALDAQIEQWRQAVAQSGFGGDIEAIIKGAIGADQSSCITLAVQVPARATVTRVLTGLGVEGDGAECPTRTNPADLPNYVPSLAGLRLCPQGYSAFEAPASDGQIWWTVAKNWSHNRTARANLRVFYRP